MQLSPLEGLLKVGTDAVSATFTGFLDLDSHTGSPCQTLIDEEVLSLTGTQYVMLC